MSAAEEPSNTAPAEVPASNGADHAAATESTSNANEAAADVNAPSLPPADDADTKDTGKETDLDMKAADTAEGATSGATVVAPTGDEPSAKKDNKRRTSTAATPSKNKLSKKKSMITLQLEAKPGDYYWARLKGYPPWPAIICDDEMLPESLLANRPVTAKRPDGSYREDFMEGGKNVRDRTYSVMYLHTNEFSWIANTDLTPLSIDEVKDESQGKKSKALWGAYQVAAEGHELEHFKTLISEHEEQMREDQAQAEAEAAEEEKAPKKAAKKTKKSKATADDEDTVMDDDEPAAEEAEEEGGKKTKASKKRKKEAESEGEGAKPAKTPKTKSIKINTKATNGDTPTTAKKTKAKTPKGKAAAASPKPELSAEEIKQKREKEVLYFRHKLQKGFLSTSEPPKDSEMVTMAEYFTQLEALDDLEQGVIKTTKIHKVLKAILKLVNIPQDDVHHFKDRSTSLLSKWQKVLAEGGADAAGDDGDRTEVAAAAEPAGPSEDVEMKDEEGEAAKEAVAAEGAKVETVGEAKEEEAKAVVPAEVPTEAPERAEASGQEVTAASNLI